MQEYYLLGFPRSGTSLTRAVLTYLTGMTPRQPQGHCEQMSVSGHLIDNKIDEIRRFYKFHYPIEGGITPDDNSTNTLWLLLRNPYENILSYMFAHYHQGKGVNKNRKFTDEEYRMFVQEECMLPHRRAVVINQCRRYRTNIVYYHKWSGPKSIIKYEKLVIEREKYVFGGELDLSTIPLLRNTSGPEFDALFDSMMEFKTSTTDQFKVSTFGRDLTKFTRLMTDELKEVIDNALEPDRI